MPIKSLNSLRKMTADKPPRILIYGPPGIGKTSLASEFPKPVFFQLEDGAPRGVVLDGWEREDLQTFGDVMDGLELLLRGGHDYQTVVVDSVTQVQRLIFDETCVRGDEKGNQKNNIEDFGYGKGYVYAQRVMHEFIDCVNALRNAGMATVLLAHSRIERFDDPETSSYDRYEIDLHTKLVGAIEQDMDAILLLKKPVDIKKEDEGFNRTRARADGSPERVVIHTLGKPAFVAKNRFNMPATIEFKRGNGFAALDRYLSGNEPAPVDEPAADAVPANKSEKNTRSRRAA